MDELRADQGSWRFDGEVIRILYHANRRSDTLLKTLGACAVPLVAVDSVEFRLLERKWLLRLRLREGVDPYAACGAMLAEESQPFRLTGPLSSELIAEYYADQIASRIGAARSDGDPVVPPGTSRALVPPLPLHIRTGEGTAFFDGAVVRVQWSGSQASWRKSQEAMRVFPLAEVVGADWSPGDINGPGVLRIRSDGESAEPVTKPAKDFGCLLSMGTKRGAQHVNTLIMAATITAHVHDRPRRSEPAADSAAGSLAALWDAARRGVLGPAEPAGPVGPADTADIYQRIRELGRLRDEDLITEEEFQTKKAELLARI